LAVTLTSGLLLVLDIAVGRTAAVVLTSTFVAGMAGLWIVVPVRVRGARRG
jgi:hypothetical protein